MISAQYFSFILPVKLIVKYYFSLCYILNIVKIQFFTVNVKNKNCNYMMGILIKKLNGIIYFRTIKLRISYKII